MPDSRPALARRPAALVLRLSLILAALAAAVLPATPAAAEGTVAGAGSSAAAPIYRSWAREYRKAGGPPMTYDPVGSSAGLKRIRARDAGFGASDVAPPEAELRRDGLVAFPIAITGIAPVINLPKVGDGRLRLTGELLARIFLGEVTRWRAPEIARLNPGLALPDLPIRVIVRSDGSGTTYNFADYLAKVHPGWQTRYGVATHLPWPAGFLPAKGSDGVVAAVKETAGAIGYVDFGYVAANELKTVQMKNGAGEFVAPSTDAFRAALARSAWARTGSFTSTLTAQPGRSTWPIVMGTFALVPQVAADAAEARQVLKFFVWAFINGDRLVQEADFVRLPDPVQASAYAVISSVTDQGGRRLALDLLGAGTATR